MSQRPRAAAATDGPVMDGPAPGAIVNGGVADGPAATDVGESPAATTTITTVAVQAGKAKIVLAILKVRRFSAEFQRQILQILCCGRPAVMAPVTACRCSNWCISIWADVYIFLLSYLVITVA